MGAKRLLVVSPPTRSQIRGQQDRGGFAAFHTGDNVLESSAIGPHACTVDIRIHLPLLQQEDIDVVPQHEVGQLPLRLEGQARSIPRAAAQGA